MRGWTASDIPDWWDQHLEDYKEGELTSFVDQNPNLFGVLVATAKATVGELIGGTLDMLRFGEGAAEGGVGGIAKDGVRLISLLGPLGKGAKVAQMGANAYLARAIVDTGGPVCGYVSGAQALRQVGASRWSRAAVAVEDLAKALNKPMSELGGSQIADRIEWFKQLGARISPLQKISTWEEVAGLTRRDGSVTMVSIVTEDIQETVMADPNLTELPFRYEGHIAHAIYTFRNFSGELKIMDRGGRVGKTGEIFSSLAELARKYQIKGRWLVRGAAIMENVFAKYVDKFSPNLPVLAMSVSVSTLLHHQHDETVAQAFEIHKIIQRGGKPALERKNPRYHVVVPGDWLSKLAQKFYGNELKWPIIYETNRDVIGKNPNLIHPGQKLLIPDLPRVKVAH